MGFLRWSGGCACSVCMCSSCLSSTSGATSSVASSLTSLSASPRMSDRDMLEPDGRREVVFPRAGGE
eukprot:396269-Prorocentrum_minimum.AAC.1